MSLSHRIIVLPEHGCTVGVSCAIQLVVFTAWCHSQKLSSCSFRFTNDIEVSLGLHAVIALCMGVDIESHPSFPVITDCMQTRLCVTIS